MKKILFLLPLMLAYACENETLPTNPDDPQGPAGDQTEVVLSHVDFSVIAASKSSVNYTPATKASLGVLSLYAEVANPSKETSGPITNFTKEENGRFLSATGVYSDGEGNYYVSYHMQGKNYHNTTIEDEVTGFIEKFGLNADGEVQNPVYYVPTSEEDFDFNHLYFDGTDFVAAGHVKKAPETPSSEDVELNDTRAIVGKVSFGAEPAFDYTEITTGDKRRNDNDTSLDEEDAVDGNSVVKNGDYYYVATRKGLAVLNADFSPVIDSRNHSYFIETPGSGKHVAMNGDNLYFLYLTDEAENPAYNTDIAAKIATFTFGTDGALTGVTSVKEYTIGGEELPNHVSPVDGKNVLAVAADGTKYAALGTGGLYFGTSTPKRFGESETSDEGNVVYGTGRPVNGVFVDEDGYVYVANGSCLSIMKKEGDEMVFAADTWSPSVDTKGKTEAEIEAEKGSANYVYVTKAATGERTVVVAYGQAGVRIFKFTPAAE